MIKKIVSVDGGKGGFKVVVMEDGKIVSIDYFPTAIGYPSDGRVELLNGAHTFSCKTLGPLGKEVLIGCEGLPIKADDNFTKNTDINKTCTTYAIAKNVNAGDNLGVVSGLTLTEYMDKEKRMQYGQNILPNGSVSAVIDGKAKEFTVSKRLVCAESTGILYVHPDWFSNPDYDSAIVDVGELNCNITAINNSNIILEASHTSGHGGRMLRKMVRRALMDSGFNVTNQQVLNAIMRGYINYHDSDKKEQATLILHQAINDYVDEIIRTLHESWPSFDALEIFFVGGTAYLLKGYFADRLGTHAHFEKDFDASRFANAIGFAIRMYQKITEKPINR